MTEDWKTGVRRLFEKSAVGFLATQGETSPETSMAPFAIDRGDFSLFRLRVTDVFWVGGFGSARKIGLATWKKKFPIL